MERQIVVPVSADEPTGDMVSWVNARVSPEQTRTLAQMIAAMKARNMEAAKPSGQVRRVEHASDAIRWLLDQVGRAQ